MSSDRIAIYPKPQKTQLIVAFAHLNEMSKSEAGEYMINKYLETLPSGEREKLRAHYQGMEDRQRRNPKSY